MRRACGTRMPMLLLTLASSLALALASATPAWADDKATREAQARFEEGLARVKAGDLEAARISFMQAYAVLHKPDILWNLALAEQKTGHLVEALGHFKQVQANEKSDRDKASAGKHVTELMAQTGHLEVAAPAGSQIMVDGAAMGIAPLGSAVDVAEGKHHVEIRTAQGASKTADADAVVGQVAHVSFLQAEASPAPAPAPAPPPGAAPTPAPAASPGLPDTPPPASNPHPFWDARVITVATVGGLAVVSAALGLSFGLASNGDASTASSLRQQNPACGGSSSAGCQQLASATASQHGAYAASEGFWVVSALLAAGAVGTWFLWPTPAPSSAAAHVQIVPTAAPGGAGAVAIGSF